MSKNATRNMKFVGQFRRHKVKFVSDYLDSVNASIVELQGFVQSMVDLEKEWDQVDTDKITPQEASDKISALQVKVDEGLQLLNRLGTGYTATLDKFNDGVLHMTEKVGGERETIILVGEVTDDLH